jgi:hypothetical protein
VLAVGNHPGYVYVPDMWATALALDAAVDGTPGGPVSTGPSPGNPTNDQQPEPDEVSDPSASTTPRLGRITGGWKGWPLGG